MSMKSEEQIQAARNRVDTDSGTKYPGMTYEQGIAEALDYVLGDITEEEFEYGATK